jgi:oxygen-independent coproporphyrinogen-3 oxidase
MIATADLLTPRTRQRLDDQRRFQELGLINKFGDFFPGGVHYPPITMYSEVAEEDLFAGYTLPADGLLDVYVHIPFCQQRCVFCHYPVKLGQRRQEKDIYLAALEKEMDIYMRRLGVDKIRARSVLFGGGTPTYLDLDQIRYNLEFFTRRVDLSQCKQFNYDLDPGSMLHDEGKERLRIMRDFGVNRLTIGLQSLNEDVLKIMNRPHNAAEAIESIQLAQDMGFQVNIEFIFGHPGETIENWIEVMEQAVTLGTEEIQLYRLKIEAYGDYQAPLKKLLEMRPERAIDPEETLAMKQLAIDILNEHGYHENLRRVFTRKREHYSHYARNQCCNLLDEIGLGLTAFSSLRDRYVLNTADFKEYYTKIENGRLPLNRGLRRSPEEQIRWAIILPLKNLDVWKPTYLERTGVPLAKVFRLKIERLKQYGLVTEDENKLALTTLGAFFADEVVEAFGAARYIPYPRSAYADGPLNPYLDNEPFGSGQE